MINSDLLRSAIADAKAVRATSLANAKAALEEAFAPRFEAMFADKLKEESEEEGKMDELQEVEAPNQVDAAGGEAKAPATKAVSKGNPKTPKGGAGDKDFKAVKAGLGPKDVPNLGKKVNESEETEEEEGKMDESGLTSEDLDEIIRELEDEVADEESDEQHSEFPSKKSTPEDGEELPPSSDINGEEDTEINAEPGSEVNIDIDQEQPGEMEPEHMNAGGLEEPGEEETGEVGATGGEEGGDVGDANTGEEVGKGFPPVANKRPAPAVDNEDENIDLEELLSALNEEAEEEEEEGKMDETMKNHGLPTDVSGQDEHGGVKGYKKSVGNKWIESGGKNHNIGGKGNIGTGATGGKPMQEIVKYKIALKESYQTIEFLRGQINEVNLLNAKLLYTNKLFKDFAGILDESYRMKIIENFDLTKSVREVKLAYALLAESLNFGTQRNRVQKIAQKPVISSKTQIRQITEGFASKQVSSTRPSQLIVEGNVMALRFKKLAGIKEPKTITPEKK